MFEISNLLNTGLDKQSLAVLVELVGTTLLTLCAREHQAQTYEEYPPDAILCLRRHRPPDTWEANWGVVISLQIPSCASGGMWRHCLHQWRMLRQKLRPPPHPSDVHLTAQLLLTCRRRAESGVNPEALAHVVKELRRESAALQQAEREAEGIRAMGL